MRRGVMAASRFVRAREQTCVTCGQGLHYRQVRLNRRGLVAVYRTEKTGGNRSNLKSHVQSVPTGLPVGLTGNRPNLFIFSFFV